ncbi:MAG: glycine cleavage system protein H [Deltaproteobacteria bacterium HGW-Deltaproteobacteria-19]|jgi:glycine cleavage system H protein|nr:MAG: glycine cleavage system protein H [Deltaproteobacteria bacterium HGW-Deltaproteobacteria-19]
MAKPNPTDRRYSREHEWALIGPDGTVTVGITDYAQEMLTDIVFVELPQMGRKVRQAEAFAVVESVKSVSDIYAPVSGEIIAANTELETRPELLNQDAFGDGWIARIKMDDPSELDVLLDAAAYSEMILQESH